MYKKLLSLFLTVAVLLGVLGMPAFAADESPAEPYVKSDTTIDFTVVESKTYAFRFEVVGPRGVRAPHCRRQRQCPAYRKCHESR